MEYNETEAGIVKHYTNNGRKNVNTLKSDNFKQRIVRTDQGY
jgi:hypothetical protein